MGFRIPAWARFTAWSDRTFSGPELSGKVLAGTSANWRILVADGTGRGNVRGTIVQ